MRIRGNKFHIIISFLISFSATSSFAGNPQRIVLIDTDDSPGDTYIDVVRDDNGVLQSLVYETDTVQTFSIQQLQSQSVVLRQVNGKNVVLLKLDQNFNPAQGGYAVVQFMYNGLINSYKDFRILIQVNSSGVTFQSSPDSSDPVTDGNSYKAVFNKLYMWKNVFFGQEVGINRIEPSEIAAADVIYGPDPLPFPSGAFGFNLFP